MRGRIAAACAALLVGLAPAGLLLSTPWLAGASESCADAPASRETRRDASSVPPIAERIPRAPHRFAAVTLVGAAEDEPADAPLIWRSPSGPAPSTAPPRA